VKILFVFIFKNKNIEAESWKPAWRQAGSSKKKQF
jgi:hypothetical protein